MKRRISPRLRRNRAFDHGSPISKIDTRPMAFVATFLAIIFLFPATQPKPHALLIDLPQYNPPFDMVANPEYLTVTITFEGVILLDGVVTELDGLAQAIKDQEMLNPLVAFHPDGLAGYGISVMVLNEISKAGVDSGSICLLETELHRNFDRVAFHTIYSLAPHEEHDLWEETAVTVILPGCGLLQPPPLY